MRLDSAVSLSTMPGARRGPAVLRAFSPAQSSGNEQWWLTPTGFQIHVGDSLHGRYIEFAPRADSLVGRVFYYSDTRNGFDSEPVSAHRVSCPAATIQ
jgi:hypothetical protein